MVSRTVAAAMLADDARNAFPAVIIPMTPPPAPEEGTPTMPAAPPPAVATLLLPPEMWEVAAEMRN
jgi:hypothetical protein